MAGDREHTASRRYGYFRAEGWYGEVDECDTLQCCHCGMHFPVRRGSGRKRGWCLNCGAVTCGNERCDACIPFMVKIEAAEAGVPVEEMPVAVSLAGLDLPKAHTKGGILLGGERATAD